MILDITENPFFILGANISDSKERIIELANEKYSSNEYSVETIDEAKENLLDLNKRLYYELRWFPCWPRELAIILDYINEVKIKKFKECDIGTIIDMANTPDSNTTLWHSDISGLVFFNTELYIFPYLDEDKTKFIIDSILYISYCYQNMSEAYNIYIKDINNQRKYSKIPEITDIDLIKTSIKILEDDVKTIITHKLNKISNTSINNIIIKIKERCKNEEKYNESTIIKYIFSKYGKLQINTNIKKTIYYNDFLNITDNPFYITGATITDNKNTIIKLCEEKLLFEDSEKISNAQEQLLNPQKRLLAEMGWFSSCSKEQLDKVLAYFNELPYEEKKYSFGIDYAHFDYVDGNSYTNEGIGNISIIDRFNIRFYSLPYLLFQKHEDDFLPVYQIKEIITLFEALNRNKENIKKEINEKRKQSGFVLIQDDDFIIKAIENYSMEIRKILSKYISINNIDTNAEIATEVVEKILSEGFINTILDDYISDYTLFTKSYLEEKKDEIIGYISNIINSKQTGEILKDNVLKILKMTKDWDKIAQPIQLLYQKKGIMHNDSKILAINLRGLAVYSNNEARKPDLSLKIITEIKKIFAELPEFYSSIKEDEKAVSLILADVRKKEEINKLIKESNARVEKEMSKNWLLFFLARFWWVILFGLLGLFSQC